MSSVTERKENQDVEEIASELDLMELNDLYEKYILIIDKYYNSQTAIAKSISKGFIDLASANFSSSTISVKKYGPDYYDNRIKAVKVAQWSEEHGYQLVNRSRISPKSEKTENGKSQTAKLLEHSELKSQEVEVSEKVSDDEETNESTVVEGFKDPSQMFGILVPQSLKDSQKAFNEALEEMIQLINITKEVREIEKLMEKVTKAPQVETLAPKK